MSDNKYVLIGVIIVLVSIIIAATVFLIGEIQSVNNDVLDGSGEDVDISVDFSGELSGEYEVTSGEESGEGSEEISNHLPNFEYDFEKGTVDLGENWKEYSFGFYNSGEEVNIIYTPSQRILTRVEKNHRNFGGDGKTFAGNWLTIALASDKSISKTIYTPKITNENEDIIALSKIQYNIKDGTIDLGENWNKYVFTITNSLQDGTIYTPQQRILKKSNEVVIIGKVFNELSLCIGLKDNKNVYKVIDTNGEFPKFQYDQNTRTLDLGENWKNYQFCYEDSNSRKTIYIPSQRILHKRTGSGGGTAEFDCNALRIMLKENNDLYKIVETVEKMPEFTYNTTTGTIDLGENWKNYKYQCGSSDQNSFGTIYTPTQRVLTRVITSDGGKNIFNADYLKVSLKNDPNTYKIIHTPRIIPALRYDRNTQSVDLGADWEKYEFSYYDAKSSSQIVYRASQRVLKKDVLNEMVGTNGKTFAGDYLNVILIANKDVYQTVYAQD